MFNEESCLFKGIIPQCSNVHFLLCLTVSLTVVFCHQYLLWPWWVCWSDSHSCCPQLWLLGCSFVHSPGLRKSMWYLCWYMCYCFPRCSRHEQCNCWHHGQNPSLQWWWPSRSLLSPQRKWAHRELRETEECVRKATDPQTWEEKRYLFLEAV